MRVFRMWAGREAYGLVAGGEVDVEPGNERMDEVIPTAVKCERNGEGQVSGRARVEIESENGGRVGHNSLDLNRVNKGLREGSVLEGSVVKAIDVVPDYAVSALVKFSRRIRHTAYFFILVLAILNPSHENCSLVRENQTIRGKIFVSRVQDGIQHRLVK